LEAKTLEAYYCVMQFVYPGFLFALFAISIPIIIHLFNFRRYKKIVFSDIRFLKQVIEKNQKQQNIKNWLVLLCRILAISFLVIAFAQPYLPYQKNKSIQKDKTVSIFVDNSFSMSAMGKDGELLETAKNKARQIVDVYKSDCQFQLLSNDFEGKHQRLVNKQDFLNMLDEIKLSASSKNLSQILSRQSQALSQNNTERISYIISDFQQKQLNASNNELDSNLSVKFIPIEAEKQQNLFIDSAWLLTPLVKPNSPVTIKVRLRNESDEKSENLPLVLSINKVQKGLQNFTCESHSYIDIDLTFTCGTEAFQNAELSIIDNPITFDDKLYFTISPSYNAEVLIINDKKENVYLKQVLKVDGYYQSSTQNIKQLDFSSFKNKQLIILNEPENISSGFIEELKKHVLNGGYLLIIPPSNSSQIQGLNALSSGLSNIQYTELTKQELKIDKINTQDDLFKGVFNKLPQNMDAPGLFAYYPFNISSNTRGSEIFSLNNGAPFIFKSNVGKGKIFYAASPFSDDFSSFQKHAFFVPFILKIALGKQIAPELYYTIGKDKLVKFKSESEDKIGYISKDKFEMVADIQNNQDEKTIFVDDQIKEAGLYQIKGDKSKILASVSFNYNRVESYMVNFTNSELEKINPSAEIIKEDMSTMKKKIELEEYGTSYWKYALFAALAFILFEMLLLRLMK
jgi:hypothetical protein